MRIVIAAILTLTAASTAWAQTYSVPASHAGLIRLSEDATGLVVGNPSIADAMLYDSRTIVVTGKVYGRTNLIALNSEGQIIETTDIAVTETDRGTLQVFRNNQRYSFTCDPVCESVPMIGDQKDEFDIRHSQREATRGVEAGG